MSATENTSTDEKIRLGGMALQNGVLVHGPKSWACAIRLDNGRLKVGSGRKDTSATSVTMPFLRGPLKLAESLWILKDLKRKLPEARFPFERKEVLAAMLATVVGVKTLKKVDEPSSFARELLVGILSMGPAVVSLKGGESAEYHGAEHIVIGTYEHGYQRAKEHERCGSHLIAPLLVAQAAVGTVVSRLPKELKGPASLAGSVLATGVATEVFSWMAKNPDKKLSRWLAKPGHDLQHSVGTKEPSPDQIEVAQAALDECLRLERN